MKIAIVTNIRSPYRKLQIEKFSKIEDLDISVYYTDKDILGRKWDVQEIANVNEYSLKGFELFKRYGAVNLGLIKLTRDNDILLIGGYEKPSYILLSIIARVFKRPYIIIFDGISPQKALSKDNNIKFYLKKFVISKASAIFGNGECSIKYFNGKFGIEREKIFNQFLTVDIEEIFKQGLNSKTHRDELRIKYNIPKDKKVIIYSGRLISRKNVDKIIYAIKQLKNNKEYHLLIIGDGFEKERLLQIADEENLSITITGFIANQIDLFKHYFMGDVLVLPSHDEPWGLVVNEAMAAGLPVIVSDECGSSLDLVMEDINGYIIQAGNVDSLSNAIDKLFMNKAFVEFGLNSKKIISQWTFENSSKSLIEMIKRISVSNT